MVIITPFIVAIGAYLATPINITVVPNWRVIVLDEAGNPLSGVSVEQRWQYYALESSPHLEKKITDKVGMVNFPKRILVARRSSIVNGYISNFLTFSVHGSTGKSSNLHVFLDKCRFGEAHYSTEKKLPEVIQIKRFPWCK